MRSEQKRRERAIAVGYSFVHIFYWMAIAGLIGFATVFLLGHKFSNTEVGVVVAAGNILTVLVQQPLARLADRHRQLPLRVLIFLVLTLSVFLSSSQLLFSSSRLIFSILYILTLTSVFSTQPLINGLNFRLEAEGIHVNYSLARGIGSMAYAFISLAISPLIERFGINVIPLIVCICAGSCGSVSLLLRVHSPTSKNLNGNLLDEELHDEDFHDGELHDEDFRKAKTALPEPGISDDAASPLEAQNNRQGRSDSFAKIYQKFLLFCIGIILLFIFSAILDAYMIHILQRAGGAREQLGFVIFISAGIELPSMLLFNYLSRKYKLNSILRFTLICFGLKSIVYYLALNMPLLIAGQFMQSVSYALFTPASVYYTDKLMPETNKVQGQAWLLASLTGGSVLGNLLGGYLMDTRGSGSMMFFAMVAAIAGTALSLSAVEKNG